MNGAPSRLSRPPAKLALIGAATALALVVSLGTSDAQNNRKAKQNAKRIYKRASVAYNLGKFDEAIGLFEEAYEVYPDPKFLFNIGQAYRQKRDCKNAIYFYKRFLSLATDIEAGLKANVEGRIADLEENCRTAEEIKDRPPDQTMPPDKTGGMTGSQDPDEEAGGEGGTQVAEAGDDDDDDDEDPIGGVGGGVSRKAGERSSVVLASAVSGPSFLSIGALDINGAQLSVGVGAGYPLRFGSIGLSLGAMVTYTPVPWNNGSGMTGTSSLTGVLFNTGFRLPIVSGLSIRSELGVGAMVLSGLGEGNVFVAPGEMADSALTMFNVRVSAGAEYAITPSLSIIADPVVYSYSPAKSGLREDIEAFARFELLAGLSYRR